ncbi:hypothetical protein P9112_006084 [Eukaryota sp. TZLM1-RC]
MQTEVSRKSSKSVMDGLDIWPSSFNCDIHGSLFIQPVVLACGHSFCNVCITDWIQRNPTCPKCRSPAPGSSKVRNYALEQVLFDITKPNIIQLDDLQELCSLSRSPRASIKSAMLNGRPVVLKTPTCIDSLAQAEIRENIVQLYHIISSLKSPPCIVNILGVTLDPPGLVTERLSCSIECMMNEEHHFSNEEALVVFEDIASALLCYHENELVYMSLSPSTVFVKVRHNKIIGAKLSPVFSTLYMGDSLPESAETDEESIYTSPEIISGECIRAHTSSDVFAFGVLLLMISTNHNFAVGQDGKADFLGSMMSLLSDPWKALISSMVSYDIGSRPSMENVLNQLSLLKDVQIIEPVDDAGSNSGCLKRRLELEFENLSMEHETIMKEKKATDEQNQLLQRFIDNLTARQVQYQGIITGLRTENSSAIADAEPVADEQVVDLLMDERQNLTCGMRLFTRCFRLDNVIESYRQQISDLSIDLSRTRNNITALERSHKENSEAYYQKIEEIGRVLLEQDQLLNTLNTNYNETMKVNKDQLEKLYETIRHKNNCILEQDQTIEKLMKTIQIFNQQPQNIIPRPSSPIIDPIMKNLVATPQVNSNFVAHSNAECIMNRVYFSKKMKHVDVRVGYRAKHASGRGVVLSKHAFATNKLHKFSIKFIQGEVDIGIVPISQVSLDFSSTRASYRIFSDGGMTNNLTGNNVVWDKGHVVTITIDLIENQIVFGDGKDIICYGSLSQLTNDQWYMMVELGGGSVVEIV